MNVRELRGRRVTVVEVGPRDGLQNERATLTTAAKINFVNRLTAARLPIIEVSAFVSPKWVPQMADAAEVFRGIDRQAGTRYAALVPNLAGLDRALASGAEQIAVFAAASESFSRKNINQGIDDSLSNYKEVCAAARSAGVPVRGYLSTVFGCPYEGRTSTAVVVDLTKRLLDMGVFEVALSDTIGIAHPGQVAEVLEQVLAQVTPDRIALHLHDTRGTALANVLASLPYGIRTFDASAGGLGGCPYAPGAAGNLATEDLIYMLNGLGVESGVSIEAISSASAFVASQLDHALPSRYAQALAASSGLPPASQ